jgi:hypothetical protein
MERQDKPFYQRGLELLRDSLIVWADETSRELTVAIGEQHKAKQALEAAAAKLVDAQNAHAAAARQVDALKARLAKCEHDKSRVIWLMQEEVE